MMTTIGKMIILTLTFTLGTYAFAPSRRMTSSSRLYVWDFPRGQQDDFHLRPQATTSSTPKKIQRPDPAAIRERMRKGKAQFEAEKSSNSSSSSSSSASASANVVHSSNAKVGDVFMQKQVMMVDLSKPQELQKVQKLEQYVKALSTKAQELEDKNNVMSGKLDKLVEKSNM